MKSFTLSIVLAMLIGSAFAGEHRSASAVRAFKVANACPTTGVASTKSCKGYIIDHIKALACGGADAPSNMQWQTVTDAKAKDKWERKGCGVQK